MNYSYNLVVDRNVSEMYDGQRVTYDLIFLTDFCFLKSHWSLISI